MLRRFFCFLLLIIGFSSYCNMDYIYKVDANEIIGKDTPLFQKITENDVQKFIYFLKINGFDESLFFLDDYNNLYTKSVTLLKFVNLNNSIYNLSESTMFKGITFEHNGKKYQYLLTSPNYITTDNYSSYIKNKKYIREINSELLNKYKHLSVDDIQIEYMDDYKLKKKFYNLNFDNEFIYHLIDLGFSVHTESETGEIRFYKFKFYLN